LHHRAICATFFHVKPGAENVTKKQSKLPDLEKSLAEITQLIETMEQGELTLDQSLGHFERGITLVKHCQKILEDAEQKVQILIQNNKQDTLADYGATDTDEDNNEDDDHA
jgi:exodeoxyribonuclease VII small subunit